MTWATFRPHITGRPLCARFAQCDAHETTARYRPAHFTLGGAAPPRAGCTHGRVWLVGSAAGSVGWYFCTRLASPAHSCALRLPRRPWPSQHWAMGCSADDVSSGAQEWAAAAVVAQCPRAQHAPPPRCGAAAEVARPPSTCAPRPGPPPAGRSVGRSGLVNTPPSAAGPGNGKGLQLLPIGCAATV